MTQKVQVLLLDDLDGTEAHETVKFTLDGQDYEIDLHSANAGALREALRPYVERARKPATARGGAKGSRTPARPVLGRERAAQIRAWAKENGIEINDRGRISAAIVDKYDAIH